MTYPILNPEQIQEVRDLWAENQRIRKAGKPECKTVIDVLKEKGLTQVQIAEQYGVDKTVVCQICTGARHRNPSELHHRTKLTPEEIKGIYQEPLHIPHGKVAKKYGCDFTTVKDIRTGKSHRKFIEEHCYDPFRD